MIKGIAKIEIDSDILRESVKGTGQDDSSIRAIVKNEFQWLRESGIFLSDLTLEDTEEN